MTEKYGSARYRICLRDLQFAVDGKKCEKGLVTSTQSINTRSEQLNANTVSEFLDLFGYLRDIDWPHQNALTIIQGEDMGARSILRTEFTDEKGSSVRVIGRMSRLN